MSKSALAENASKRMATFTVTPELVLQLLKVPPEGQVIDGRLLTATHDAIPEDARVLQCGVNERGDIAIVMESEHLCPVGYGEVCPTLTPTYTLTEIVDQAAVTP